MTLVDNAARRRPNYAKAKAEAQRLLKKNGVTKPPVPVREIVEREGVDVVFARFNTLHRDVAGFTDFRGAKIYVNMEDGLNRQTFTIAHEFGHWVLHRTLFDANPRQYNILLRRPRGPNTDPLEKEANAFAAELLVPMNLLHEVKDYLSLSDMANLFAVSEEVIQHRLSYA